MTSRRVRLLALAVAAAASVTTYTVIDGGASAHADQTVSIPGSPYYADGSVTISGTPVFLQGTGGACPGGGAATLSGPLTITVDVPAGVDQLIVQLGSYASPGFEEVDAGVGGTTVTLNVSPTGGGNVPGNQFACASAAGSTIPLYVTFEDAGYGSRAGVAVDVELSAVD